MAPAEQDRYLTIMLTIEFSRRLAYIGGVIAPLAETIRRWSTWQENPANFFDDYLLGALLIYGAWRTGRNVHDGQRFLIAAWGVACGLGLLFILSAIARLESKRERSRANFFTVDSGNQRHCVGHRNSCANSELETHT